MIDKNRDLKNSGENMEPLRANKSENINEMDILIKYIIYQNCLKEKNYTIPNKPVGLRTLKWL